MPYVPRVFALAFLEIQAAYLLKIGVDLPFIQPQQRGELGGNLVIRGKVDGFAPRGPATMQRGQHGLADALQNFGHACG